MYIYREGEGERERDTFSVPQVKSVEFIEAHGHLRFFLVIIQHVFLGVDPQHFMENGEIYGER